MGERQKNVNMPRCQNGARGEQSKARKCAARRGGRRPNDTQVAEGMEIRYYADRIRPLRAYGEACWPTRGRA